MTSTQFLSKSKEARSERQEQIEVVRYLKQNKILHLAVPNGGSRNKLEAINLKKEGVSAGVPDLFICVPNKYYHGLFIEMKKRARSLKNGKKSITHTKVSPNQEKWLRELNKHGFYAIVCYGSDEAIEAIEDYMDRIDD